MSLHNPKGTRDILPEMMIKRQYLFGKIRRLFEHHAFVQIETPAFERTEVLLGKYGEEGDKLIFKILNSGNFLEHVDVNNPNFVNKNYEELTAEERKELQKNVKKISDKGLRYDLTIPLARFVAQHQAAIFFPFKRYQIQTVWRADRPQKGRYQEFYQCDADILGSESKWDELECLTLFDELFTELQLPVVIHLNHRKILEAFIQKIGAIEYFEKITTIIDKLDKIGWQGVYQDLEKLNLDKKTLKQLDDFLHLEGDNFEKLNRLSELLKGEVLAQEALEELNFLLQIWEKNQYKNILKLDLHLVRGLNYYTGAIFEVTALQVKMGSIASGGRYANLTDFFGLKNKSGIGLSFGAERIFDILEELNLFPTDLTISIDFFFLNFGDLYLKELFPLIQQLRKKYKVDYYSRADKIKKQMKYADERNAKYVLSYGEDEQKEGKIKLRNMQTGEERKIFLKNLQDIDINFIT